jgi:hypothetical protein
MIRHIKRYLAIRSYMRQLSRELARRFDKRSHYSIEMVTQAVQRGGLSPAFIAYAHAAYCTKEDFDTHYLPLQVACTYRGLRQTIARRYFSGQTDFDAKTIIARFCRIGFDSDGFYESGLGGSDQGGGAHGH